ncbi:hypothetical protein CBR_g21302 [Chara braunii]|uniref:Ubiquitin carboxyl-terminal hydrolase n=1 Tax=Chara braunii TaxID=69332 RepID=A0A388L1F8_CHABU|nr:hypothetical protein CBR_g21302 [Chara braunii]|eukprot:GBG76062.1 hypothetical protein CBR_g21302 [Chara braunii]
MGKPITCAQDRVAISQKLHGALGSYRGKTGRGRAMLEAVLQKQDRTKTPPDRVRKKSPDCEQCAPAVFEGPKLTGNDDPDFAPPRNSIRRRKLDVESMRSDQWFSFKGQEARPFRSGFLGMTNLGNTCYMNAVLQALVSLGPFIADMQHAALMESSLPSSAVYKALLRVVLEAKNGGSNGSKTINPSALKESIGMNDKRFTGARQQDAHEFLCQLLELIQIEVCGSCEAKHHSSPGRRSLKVSLQRTLCPTTRSFSCIVEHRLKCRDCEDESVIEEMFRHLSLDIVPERKPASGEQFGTILADVPDVRSLIEAYFEDETFTKKCEKCGCDTTIVRHKICRLPRVLVLHLKRFHVQTTDDGRNYRCIKRNDPVKVLPQLDLGFCCSPSTRCPIPLQHQKSISKGADVCASLPRKGPLADVSNTLATNGNSRGTSATGQQLAASHGGVSASVGRIHSKERPDINSCTNPPLLERVVHESGHHESRLPGPNRQLEEQEVPSDSAGTTGMLDDDEDLARAIALSLQSSAAAVPTDMEVDGASSESVEAAENQGSAKDEPPSLNPLWIDVVDEEAAEGIPERKEDGTLSDCCSSEYSLHGIISHIGAEVSCGHFVADILQVDQWRSQWYRHDDSLVSPVSDSSVFSMREFSECYLLFYVHKEFANQCPVPQKRNLMFLAAQEKQQHASPPQIQKQPAASETAPPVVVAGDEPCFRKPTGLQEPGSSEKKARPAPQLSRKRGATAPQPQAKGQLYSWLLREKSDSDPPALRQERPRPTDVATTMQMQQSHHGQAAGPTREPTGSEPTSPGEQATGSRADKQGTLPTPSSSTPVQPLSREEREEEEEDTIEDTVVSVGRTPLRTFLEEEEVFSVGRAPTRSKRRALHGSRSDRTSSPGVRRSSPRIARSSSSSCSQSRLQKGPLQLDLPKLWTSVDDNSAAAETDTDLEIVEQERAVNFPSFTDIYPGPDAESKSFVKYKRRGR